ncbi:MAG: MFS transporter [Planctomycetes bacterium]|nr:MFS transporter [Planctomycetota bacterium]
MTGPDATPPPAPPVTLAREHRAAAALALAAFALNLNTNVLGALLPFLPSALAAVGGGDKLLLAAAAVGSAIGALLVGPLAARRGRRGALVGGLLLFVCSCALHPLAGSFWPFLALRALSGLAVGVAYASASSLVAELWPYARRGRAMGIFTAAMFLAIPVGLPLAVELARRGLWSGIFVVQALVGALGCWLALRAVPASAPVERRGGGWSVLREPGVVPALLATMLHVGSFFVTVQLASTWLDETGLVAKADQPWVWVGLGAVSVFGSAGFGGLSDRIGKRNFVLITSVVLVGCFGMLSQMPRSEVLIGLAVVLAATAAARTGPLQALVSSLVPGDRYAAVMGLRGFAMQAGVAAFALGAAPVAAELGFRGVLMLAALCQFLSYVAIRFGVREVVR